MNGTLAPETSYTPALMGLPALRDVPTEDGPLTRVRTSIGIPRLIHYIWFGGTPHPAGMKAIIEGWRRVMPDHEIIEWNETNFDVTAHPWMKRMYDEGRFAFASDYARFCILLKYGGIYLDTDVELKKSLAPFLNERSLWSFEFDSFLSTCIIATVPGHPLIAALLAEYEGLKEATVNNAIVTTHFLRNYPEFRLNNRDQRVGRDIRVLPKEYFIVPSFDKRKNFGVHRANNQWKPDHKKVHVGRFVRSIIGDVLFFKLVNMRMTWRSEYLAMDRARRRH